MWFGSGKSEILDSRARLFKLIVCVDWFIFATIPVAALFSSFLNNISTASPTLRLDLSISLVSKTIFDPDIDPIWNLEDVL